MKLVIDFCSKDCKENMHEKCCGSWLGLNTSIICNCICHNKKLSELAEVVGPEANITSNKQPSMGAVQG